MAFSLQNNHKNLKKKPPMAEINITPFVDVLLVLLIIFMVAAPLITSSIDVNLPQGTNNPIQEKTQTITVSINSDNKIFLQDELIKLPILTSKLKEISANNLTNKIFVRADKSLDYGSVMDIVKTISQAGFSNVVLVTEIAK
jgi:biopolymer transport protein TolR